MAGKPRWKIWLVLGLCAVVVGVFGGGWYAARRLQSPAQREAAARPPAAGPIFDAVTTGTLADQVSGSGSVTYASVAGVAPAELAANPVITARPHSVGAIMKAGDVTSEIDGRPVFLLPGAFDFYRDLAPGATGPDVRQLQTGLRRAGYDISAVEDGSYGKQTTAAVKALYTDHGYTPPAGLPLTEVAVTPTLPATLDAVPPVGSHPAAADPLAKLARGQLIVSIGLDSGAFVRITAGVDATVTIIGSAEPVSAKVTGLTASTTGGQSTVTLTPAGTLDAHLAGHPAVGIITIQIVAKTALLVPTRAIATNAAGTHRVLVKGPGGIQQAKNPLLQPVAVTVLGNLAGVSAVKPSPTNTLRVGDLVQVG
jgi:peptidoglycan hydrolase-like protein with peptidoglycan-binding domain